MNASLRDIFVIEPVDTADRITAIARELKQILAEEPLPVQELVSICDGWSSEVVKHPAASVPGAVFLGMWLRKGTLTAILARELGERWHEGWVRENNNRFKTFPVGLVGHWPAANVQILPLLSGLCALLGGNVSLVRVPPSFSEPVQYLLESLRRVPGGDKIARRFRFVSFRSDIQELQEAMARSVDGAMIWGGKEAVTSIRALPFPFWTRFTVFGPRVSVAALDRGAWTIPEVRSKWCLRLARDVWQFDQMACSSPQVLFVERDGTDDIAPLLDSLAKAFREENRAHPRFEIDESLTSAIVRARATTLLNDATNSAIFPETPDWSILLHNAFTFPEPVQGKTLHVVPVDDLRKIVSLLDGNVQTVGLGMSNPQLESELAELAGKQGVDRIVRLGLMHVFDSPWDGNNLILPMVRRVRHAPSINSLPQGE
ncbi:MAG: acyl-CoA reductase [Pelobacteraceae bacterium]